MSWVDLLPGLALCITCGDCEPGQTPEHKQFASNYAYWQTTTLEINLVTPQMSTLLPFKRKKNPPHPDFNA